MRQVRRKDRAEPLYGRFGVLRKDQAEPWFGRFGVRRKDRTEPWFGRFGERNGPNNGSAGPEKGFLKMLDEASISFSKRRNSKY